MRDIFASAKSVLRRADHHITDLESAIKFVSPDQPYRYSLDRDAKTGEHVHKLRFSWDFSHDISCILFDAINNMRAALDQMTYAIAMRHNPSRNAEDFAPFPFAKDASHWPNKINGMKNYIPAELCSVFEGFKAYKGGKNTLWAMNHLANFKKHAILIPVWFGWATVRVMPDPGAKLLLPGITSDKEEIEIYRSAEPPERHPNIQITYSIVLSHPEKIIQGQPPIPLLNAMRSEVEAILRATEAECRTIGLVGG